MYFVLYDRFLNSLGETYLAESWSRTQRATDFDVLKVVGEQIPYSIDPFFVVVNDPQGKQILSGLASTPQIDESTKKTTIQLKDYTTLFNDEIVINWSKLHQEELTLDKYLIFVFQTWLGQSDIGFSGIRLDVSRLSTIPWDTVTIPLGLDTESVSVHTLVYDAITYYGIYCIPELDIYHKTLTFRFYRSGTVYKEIRLKDFGINSIEKSFGSVNRTTVYDHAYSKISQWAITKDNSIVKLPSGEDLVYPSKNQNFIAEKPSEDLSENQAVSNATYDAVMELTKNLYQEDIELDVVGYSSVTDLTQADFSYKISVYTEDGLYKDLPVGEIETDSSGKHLIRLGYRVQEITQEL